MRSVNEGSIVERKSGKTGKAGYWLYISFGIVFLIMTSLVFGRISLGSESLIADSVTVIWTNDEKEQVDLTNQVRKEKVVKLLDKYSREWKPAEKPEQEPRKGDLEISVTDQGGDAHHIYLSKEGDNYYYSEGGENYRIPEGDELYQEIAAAL